jgi:hypothetical protein
MRGRSKTKCEKISEMGKECFIQPAIEMEHEKHHEGYTHKLLGLPKDYNLRHVKTLLEKIVTTPINKIAKNPLKVGEKFYKVTVELKRHVNFSLNLIRITEKRIRKERK